jgi:hypothetical protein
VSSRRFFGITILAAVSHLGAAIVTSIAVSAGAIELNPLFSLLGPMVNQIFDFGLIAATAVFVWLLPIPRWAKMTNITLLALATSFDFVRDLVIFLSR